MSKFIERYLESTVEQLCFARNKMAFISGPRQCGKTTLAKQLLKKRHHRGKYCNWDETSFRRMWTKNPQELLNLKLDNKTKKPLLILDEIHKAKLWKRSLKGLYDTNLDQYDIIVTGSTRLSVYRKGSDSLLGRYHHFRLHPFSLAELLEQSNSIPPNKLLSTLESLANPLATKKTVQYFNRLYQFGPFPEPLFAKNQKILNLWHRGRVEKIVREDLRDLSRLPELSQIEMLVSLLPERAASSLSLKSLSEDLEVSYTTVKRWMDYLYELYYAFKIPPFFKSLNRSLKKESKLYLWDWSEIANDAAKFENMIASHLLKYCHYLTDSGIGNFQLYYLRNKEGQEIDFLITHNQQPWLPIEVKLHNDNISNNWPTFLAQLPCKTGIQLVKTPNVMRLEKIKQGKVLIISAINFLTYLI